MAALTVLNVTRAGLDIQGGLVAADAGLDDTFANDGSVLFYANNGGGGAVAVTFDASPDPFANEPTQSTVPVADSLGAGAELAYGPFPIGLFGSTVTVNYDQVASLTVAAVRLPRA